MSEVQIKKVGWWHERLVDWLIANPDKDLAASAAEFNCSRSWISIIKHSDVFKSLFAERSGVASDTILAGVKERLTAVAETSLDLVQERLDQNGKVMPYEELLETSSMALRSLGYGIKSNSAPLASPVNVNITQQVLSDARTLREKTILERQANVVDLPSEPRPQISSSRPSLEDI